jgi:hypothetical protein
MRRNKNRQQKAQRVIILASRRMMAKMLAINPNLIKESTFFSNEEVCAAIRELYEINNQQIPDRLTKAYDLADLVR